MERFEDSPVDKALRHWGAGGIALAALLTSFMGFLSWRSAGKAAEDADWVAHTHAAMATLATTLKDAVDVETGARGFAVTGEEAFLEPYQEGQTTVAQDLETLRQLIVGPAQQWRLDLLEQQINARIETARRMVAERRETGAVPAKTLFLEGKRRMDALRATVAEMQAEESKLLDQRSVRTQEARRSTKIITSAGTLMGVALLLLAGFRIGREINNSTRMRGQLKAFNADLEKRVEERTAALHESREQYRVLFDEMLMGFALFEPIYDETGKPCDFRYLEVNQAHETHCGLGRDRVIGKTIREVLPTLEPVWIETYGKLAITGESIHFDSYAESIGRWLELTVFRTCKNQVAVTFAGITNRKRAEESSRESEERFQKVMENMTEGLVLSDLEGRLLYWNRVALEMHGFGSAEDLRRPLSEVVQRFELSTQDGAVIPIDQWPMPRIYRGDHLCDYQLRVRRLDVDWERVFSYSGTTFLDSAGKRVAFVTISDITERKRAEEEIRKLNDELEQRIQRRTAELQAANKELEAFTYSVSHDLRAPLRHIGGFSKMLVEEFGSTLDPTAQHYLERIQSGTQKMGVLVDELLNLARVGRHALNLQPTRLNAIVAEVVAILQPDSEGRQVEWIIADLPAVECDPVLVKQVFQNLLANALKFTRPRAHAVVEVSHKEDDGQLVFMVRDNGIGFSMKYVDQLFGVFQRLHRSEDFEGTGIGLATVQRIVQRHGGRAWAEAESDKGAAFHFTLGAGKQAESKSNGATAGGRS